MIFLFDTNIVLHYLKEDAVMRTIKSSFNPFAPGNETWFCFATIGELRSIALANQWGEKKRGKLEAFVLQFLIPDPRTEEIINRYAEIETYSQRRLPNVSPQPISPRNMGKNDLWIAATASVLSATLLTTDKDFDHLDEVFLKLERIES
jgi:predicted nucleic acid-binding protein